MANSGSLTHRARPGKEPTSWFLVGFISASPRRELLRSEFLLQALGQKVFLWLLLASRSLLHALACASFLKSLQTLSALIITSPALWPSCLFVFFHYKVPYGYSWTHQLIHDNLLISKSLITSQSPYWNVRKYSHRLQGLGTTQTTFGVQASFSLVLYSQRLISHRAGAPNKDGKMWAVDARKWIHRHSCENIYTSVHVWKIPFKNPKSFEKDQMRFKGKNLAFELENLWLICIWRHVLPH